MIIPAHLTFICDERNCKTKVELYGPLLRALWVLQEAYNWAITKNRKIIHCPEHIREDVIYCDMNDQYQWWMIPKSSQNRIGKLGR